MNMNNKIDMNNKNRDMSNKKFAIIGSLIGLIILLIILFLYRPRLHS